VGELRHWLIQRGGAWAETLAEGRALRMAVDHAVARPDTAIADGCEVAFFPPVTGG
jgi:sulfur-carrier protein